MSKTRKCLPLLIVALAAVVLLSGCTNWQKKYKSLNVEHQNLKGLYENCVTSLDSASSEKAQLSQQIQSSQQTIEDLQQQIQQRNVSPADATGFSGMDVAFDAQKGTITVTLPNEILFSPGKASLRNTYVTELDRILSVLRQRYSSNEIDVVGHTDSDPIRKSKWKDNWQLSAERALSVLRYLTDRGVSGSRIRGVAAGEYRPIASNANSSGKSKNRRVEIVVHVR